MTGHRGGIDVVLVIGGWASVEDGAAVGSEGTGAANVETGHWWEVGITLPLHNLWGQDATVSEGVDNSTVVDGVLLDSMASANAVLPIVESSDGAGNASRSSEAESARSWDGDGGGANAKGSN